MSLRFFRFPLTRAALALACAMLATAALAQTDGSASGDDDDARAPKVLIDGSSTVHPLTVEALRRFQRRHPGALIEARHSGTRAGFERFCTGQTAANNASRAMTQAEAAICQRNGIAYLRLPLATDAISIVVHPDNDWASDITLSELRALWASGAEGRIMQWSQLRPGWPERPIRLHGRGSNSGTYDAFTAAVLGPAQRSRQDYETSDDEETLAARVASDPEALGFLGIGAYHRHWDSLKLLAVDGVHPSLETVADGRYARLSRPLQLYVNRARLRQHPELEAFLRHYLRHLPEWLHFTGFLPVSEAERQAATAALLEAG